MREWRVLGRAAGALADFLRGFLGLPGSPGTASVSPPEARRALEQRAARRPTCC